MNLYANVHQNFSNTGSISIFIFGTPGEIVDLEAADGFAETVTIGEDGSVAVEIPQSLAMSGTAINGQGLKIAADGEITAYLSNREFQTTDLSVIFEESSLGRSYVLASAGDFGTDGGQFSAQAIEDGTELTFTLPDGQSASVTLNAGESFKFSTTDFLGNDALGLTVDTSFDLTGTTVTSSQPVAVFSGHSCTTVGAGFCDHIVEQMPAIEFLEQNYVVGEMFSSEGLGNNLIRVIASEDETEVRVDGELVATLGRGEFHEFTLSEPARSIQTSEPALVAQYLQGATTAGEGDPALSFVPGTATWLSSYIVATPSGSEALEQNLVNIVIPTAAVASFQINGANVDPASFTAIDGTDFSVANLPIEPGIVRAEASETFQLSIFGYDLFDSFLTFGGANFASGLSQVPPEPQDDLFSVEEQATVSGNLFADNGNGPDIDRDGDPLTVVAINGSADDLGNVITLENGAQLQVDPDGSFTYVASLSDDLEPGETIIDTLTYTVSDGTEGHDRTATITVAITDDRPIIDLGNVITAGSDGDPHISTFDRVGYSFQAAGEFILFRTTDGGSEFQVRQEPFLNSSVVSVNTAITTQLGDTVVGVYAGQDTPLIIDGVEVDLTVGETITAGNGTVSFDGRAYTIIDEFGNGVWSLPSTEFNFMNLRAFAQDDFGGQIEGLLGNGDNNPANDFALRDGTVLEQPIPATSLYGAFADSWRIDQDSSLFDYAPGESTETFTNRDFPSNVVTLDDLDPQARENAEAIAIASGLEPGSFAFETTVIDIALTGVNEFAEAAEEALDFGGDDDGADVVEVDLNQAPELGEDEASVDQDGVVEIDVFANDSDPEDDAFRIVSASDPNGGTVDIDGGVLRFTPASGFSGETEITYQVEDDAGNVVSGLVRIQVGEDNQDDGASFPDLNDRSSITPSQINGVPSNLLTTTGLQQVSVAFVSETALFENTLGFFARDEEGTISEVGIAFASADGPDYGSGTLLPGDQVTLGTFAEGTEIGFFLIQRGAELGLDFADGTLRLTDENGDPTDLTGNQPPLLMFESNGGDVTNINNPLFFSVDNQPSQPLNNALNDGGNTQFISGFNTDGVLQIGVEDLVLSNSDGDFDDLVFTVSIDDAVQPNDGIDIFAAASGNVLFNNGAGQFVDSGQRLGTDSQVAALGDLDGDGDLDAVVYSPVSSTSDGVFFNDGNGIFSASADVVDFGIGDVDDLVLGDADGDGDLDVFVANDEDTSDLEFGANKIFLNDGAGSFEGSGFVFPPSNPIRFFTDPLGDEFDADDGSQEFSPDLAEGANLSSAIDVGDLDGDGDLDAVIANQAALDQILINDGTGNFTEAPRTGTIRTSDVALGDMDGDGDLDAVFVGADKLVMLNDGTGNFVQGAGFGLPDGGSDAFNVALGDLDGDGDLDAVVSSFANGDQLYFNDGDGRFGANSTLSVEASDDVVLGDLDGDDDLDAILVHDLFGSQANTALLNDGNGNFLEGDTNVSAGGLALGDLDGEVVA